MCSIWITHRTLQPACGWTSGMESCRRIHAAAAYWLCSQRLKQQCSTVTSAVGRRGCYFPRPPINFSNQVNLKSFYTLFLEPDLSDYPSNSDLTHMNKSQAVLILQSQWWVLAIVSLSNRVHFVCSAAVHFACSGEHVDGQLCKQLSLSKPWSGVHIHT